MEQLKLNMIPNGVNPVFHASQYDKGRQIRFVLDETLSGAEVTTSYRAKDGTEYGNVQMSVSGNTITDTIPEEVLTDYGIIEGEVNIGGIGSLNFFVEVEKDAYDGGVITTQTASGAIATFNTNMVEPFKSLKSDINPVQSGTGTPSPDNVRPISGFSGANIVRCGKNFANIRPYAEWSVIGSYLCYQNALPKEQNFYMSFADNDTSVDVSGCYFGFLDDEYSGGSITGHFKWILNNGTYTANNNLISGPKLLNGFVIYPTTEATYNKIMSRYKIQVELGSTASDYEPYNGQTATVNFGQTVYGGVADVTNGKVNVTHGLITLNGSETWIQSGNSAYINNTDARIVNEYGNGISDQYEFGTWGDVTGAGSYGKFTIYKNTAWTAARIAFALGTQSVADFKASLANSPVTLVYELATPIEITTTPENLTAISGENNVFADTNGDTTVEYYIEV